MWHFIEDTLRLGVLGMEEKMNHSSDTRFYLNESDNVRGCMLITPIRFIQIRVKPILTNRSKGFRNRYDNEPDGSSFYGFVDFLPRRGYQEVVYFDEKTTLFSLSKIRESDWIDQNTRHFLIDFSLLNLNSHIVSSYRLRFDFRRAAPFWQTNSFHLRFAQPGNQFYYTVFIGFFFVLICAYNTVKELLLMYKSGPLKYFRTIESYVEILKIVLSVLLVLIYIRKGIVAALLLKKLRYAYVSRETTGRVEFVNFFEVAVLDYMYTIFGGFLAFLCIFQIFYMLSKIRRLLVFIRLLVQTVTLFYMPLVIGLAFASLSFLLFGSTTPSFANLSDSYLVINQYFIKPQAIYYALTDSHPYIGPWFVFCLGFCINFFMVNFFIVFLNEAYSSILNQIRIDTYKVREKTKLEYVYEFLGIQSTIVFDIEEDLILKDKEKDRDFLKDIKRLQAI
ncbi:polycystin-2 [Plakobranchus ocellatus]|uniref:Polycystin-2 n=1 Tax=Plakobranchus ocellatus TaxID=259542 RepID=A0AAV4ABB7_9GAST|nr:polycystin-2 [Plakobranchus ocellatus]